MLAGFDNYYAYCKGCFPSISTVWNNGHFILGREGYGQPSPGGQPISRAQMKESAFRLVRASGAARREGFLLMCLNFPKGGCYAVASGLFLRAQCAEVSLYTAALPCAFSPMWDVAACRKTFPPLLLVAVWSFRKAGQFLKERQKPLSLSLSPSLSLSLSPHFSISPSPSTILLQLEYILQVIEALRWQMFIDGCISQTLALVCAWVQWTLKITGRYLEKDIAKWVCKRFARHDCTKNWKWCLNRYCAASLSF